MIMFLDSEALKNDKQYLCQFIREKNFIHNFFSVAEIFISYNSSTKKCPFPSLQMFKYEIRNTKLKGNIHFACLGHCMNVHPAFQLSFSLCRGAEVAPSLLLQPWTMTSTACRQWWGHSAGRIKAGTTGTVVSANADWSSSMSVVL